MLKISVIVPIYNVENYIHRCIDSILAQTFTDFELILVDDGSPDNCGKICDEYAKKDSRINVIHKENGGLSSARNAGLDIASGDYIVFVDSDDYVEKEIADSKAEEHYNNIKSNIELLEKNNLNTLDSIKDGKIISKYISQEQRLDKVLVQYINDEETQKMEELIEKYTEILFKNTYEENDYNNTIFAKYNIEIEDKNIIKNLHFLKNGLWDLIFQNCFVVDNELYFFDQEWIEDSVPAEYVLYRAFYYTIPLRKEFFISEDKFGLKPFIPIFEKLDSQLQQSIFDKKMWDFYYKDKYYNLDATKQEVINLNIQKSALEADRDRYKEELEKVSKAYQQYVDSIRSRKAYKIVKFFRRGKKND